MTGARIERDSAASTGAQIPIAQGENYRWVVLAAAVTAQMTASVVSQGVYVLVPFWQAAFDLSKASAGLTVSFMNAGQILSMIFLGFAIDRYGERSVVAVTMILMGLSAITASILGGQYTVLLFFLTCLGMFYASVQPGGTRAIIKWFPPNMRGFAMGLRQAGLPLGTALAALLLPVLALRYSWQAAVFVQGVIGILGGVLFGLFHRDNVSAATKSAASAAMPVRELIKTLFEKAAFLPVLIAGIVMATFQYTLSTYIVIYLSGGLKLDVLIASFVFALAQGLGVVGRVSLAGISDYIWPGRRLRSLQWTILACAALTIGLVFLPVEPPLWLLVPLFVVLGLLGIGWYPLWLVQVGEMAPANSVASTVSFAMTLNLVAIILTPPAFGLIADLSGYGLAWSTLAILLLLCASWLGWAGSET